MHGEGSTVTQRGNDEAEQRGEILEQEKKKGMGLNAQGQRLSLVQSTLG